VGLPLVSVVCCKVDVSATGQSVVCVFFFVIECYQIQLKTATLTVSRKEKSELKGKKSKTKWVCIRILYWKEENID